MKTINEHETPIFQLMVESAPDAMILVDGSGIITLVNHRTELLFGYTRSELIGHNFEILIPSRYREHHRGYIMMFFNNPKARDLGAGRELFALRKDGTEFPVEIGLNPIPADEPLIMASVIDISKRKQSEARFQALIENNIDAILMLDEKGIVTYQSPSTEKIMGYKAEEVIGTSAAGYFHPNELPVVFGRMEEAMNNPGKAIYTRNRIRHKDGHYIYTEGTTTNFLQDENIKAFVGNFRDITDRRIAEDKLLTANRIYAFISAINKAVAHCQDEHTLFNEACRIAVETGKFEMAFIGKLDFTTKNLKLIAHYNTNNQDLEKFGNYSFGKNGLIDNLLVNGKYSFVNDYLSTPYTIASGEYILNHYRPTNLFSRIDMQSSNVYYN